MEKLLIEVIATHSCTGCKNSLPSVVQQFCEDTGKQVEYKFYPVWDFSIEENKLDYILTHIDGMRKGLLNSNGFFLNGEWLPLSHHNAQQVVEARKKLFDAAGMEPETNHMTLFGRGIEELRVNGSKVNMFQLADNEVHELGSFSTNYKNIWFFEGSIKELSINACPVEKFIYMGYDVNKLIKIANQHPELFENKETGDIIEQEIQKVNINDVKIRLLSLQDLNEGRHSCIINDCRVDKDSKLHKVVAEKFGGWGYEAVYQSQTCGFMGIMPKDISYKDAGYLPPSDISNELVLLLTCYAGGGVFGPHFNRIGIAKKMINQAINDAREKKYQRIEAYAHPEVEPVLINCGFIPVEWKTDKDSPQIYYTYNL